MPRVWTDRSGSFPGFHIDPPGHLAPPERCLSMVMYFVDCVGRSGGYNFHLHSQDNE